MLRHSRGVAGEAARAAEPPTAGRPREVQRVRYERLRRYIDPWSAVIIAVTLLLFVVALLVKGLTSALLLEAGVFLVSVKLIVTGYKASVQADKLQRDLTAIGAALARVEDAMASQRSGDAGTAGDA